MTFGGTRFTSTALGESNFDPSPTFQRSKITQQQVNLKWKGRGEMATNRLIHNQTSFVTPMNDTLCLQIQRKDGHTARQHIRRI